MTKLVHQDADIAERLTSLMLERDWLRNAVLAGDAGASSSTALHPPGDSGFRRWSDTVAGLRRQALPHGWEMSNAQNYCTVFNGESRAAIVVMAGDPMTGMRIGSPTSRYPKGVATAQRIARNNGQASLFPSMKSNDEVVEEDCVTYVLVQYATEVGVQVELSLPSSMSSSGYVDEWDERILLPMVDPRGTEPDAEVPELENSPSIDFAVSAR